ncbi:MAG: dUTP diphosphatase [Mycoplasma sp.]
MKLKFKKLEDGIIGLTTPAIIGDAGYDIYCAKETIVPSHGAESISTKVAVELPSGYWLEIMPKSGLATKYNIAVHNGVVDNGYRGEIVVHVYNHGENSYTFKKNEKIAQCILRKLHVFELEEVGELSNSARGEKGFGSTGK